MPIASLVGHASTGKTTLFYLLTSEHKETSSWLFTTLPTATQSLKVDENQSIAYPYRRICKQASYLHDRRVQVNIGGVSYGRFNFTFEVL
jgi:ribosome-binding ATPase YchF (GTP1/OBG family)